MDKSVSSENVMGLLEEVRRYEDNVSIYPISRTDKDGNKVPSGYGIAFRYDDLMGKQGRKVLTSKVKEELLPKRTAFLTALYYEKQEQIKEEEQFKLLSSVIPEKLLKKNISCDKRIKDAVEMYLVMHKARVAYKTHQGEISNSKHVVKWLGDKQISDIRFNDYQCLLNEVAKGRNGKRASKKLVRNVKSFFSRLIRFCKKQNWLSAEDVSDILDDVEMPKTARKSRNAKYVPMSEMGKMLNILNDNRRYYLIVKILLLTGMRGQELFALEKEDLMKDKSMIYVRKALIEQEKTSENIRHFGIGDTKTEDSERVVPAIPEVFEYFEELEKLQIENGSRNKSYEKGNEKYLIVDSKGQIVDKTCLNRNLGLFLKRHGADGKITFHMPRHCYTTYLKLLGADKEDVEFSLGHSMNGVRYEYLADIVPEYILMLIPEIKKMADNINEAEKAVE